MHTNMLVIVQDIVRETNCPKAYRAILCSSFFLMIFDQIASNGRFHYLYAKANV